MYLFLSYDLYDFGFSNRDGIPSIALTAEGNLAHKKRMRFTN